MFSVHCARNNDQTIKPLGYVSKCSVAKVCCCNLYAMVCGSSAVTLLVKAEILQVKFIAEMFHEKTIRKFGKKLESKVHEPFSTFHRYSKLTCSQKKFGDD